MKLKTIVLFSFILLKFALQYLVLSTDYDLQRDEYLHLDQGSHLAWGYLSLPPLTSWISYVIGLLGNSIFWVKFFPALFGALTILIVWKAIEELEGNLFALILGASCILLSVLLRLNTLYQPNSFDVLSWTALYFTLIKYIKTEKPKWLFIGAIVFGVGFLNKYNIVFLVLGMVPAILLTEQRRVFLKREFYFAALIGAVIILPNLGWQFNNGFPVVRHLKELSETQLVNVSTGAFLRSQMLFFAGSLYVIVAAVFALFFYKPFHKYRAFSWAFFFTLTVFIICRAKDYYAIGIYPIYISFGAVFLEKKLIGARYNYLRPLLIAVPVVFFILTYNVAFPNKTPQYIIAHKSDYQKLGLLRWDDGKDHQLPQDYADMLGWKELARKVDRAILSLPKEQKTLVLCDNYGQAGAINYYSRLGIKTVSFNADYIDWFDFTERYDNVIRVKEAKEKESELEVTSPFFRYSKIAGSVDNIYSREFGTTIFLFKDAKIDIRKRLRDEIAQKKGLR